MNDEHEHSVTLSEEQRKEVKQCLISRREALDKEKKKLEQLGLDAWVIDEVLVLHTGDGVSSGLGAKFGPKDNVDLFEAPEPVGGLTFCRDDGTIFKAFLDLEELLDGLWSARTDPAEKDACARGYNASQFVDSEGQMFRLKVDIRLSQEHLGQKCSVEDCWATENTQPCGREDCPNIKPDIEPPPGSEPMQDKDEAEIKDKVLQNARALAIEVINSATEVKVKDRRRLVAFVLECSDQIWLKAAAKRTEGQEFPIVPLDWQPAGSPDVTEDYAELSMGPAARIIAKERQIPIEYLEGMGTGQNGKLTKADVGDAVSRWVSETAPKD